MRNAAGRRRRDFRLFLDARGEALLRALPLHPLIVKPNRGGTGGDVWNRHQR